MAAVHLADAVGGNLFLGFISAVAFATILAVVAGLTLAGASAVSHDLYANVFRKGASERDELKVSKITVLVLGVVAILLGILFEKQNIAFMVGLAFSIAASCNFPIILLSMYWSKLTTRGAMIGGWLGLLTAVILMILGPTIWVQILGHESAIFPYEYPALFSIAVAFIGIWVFSATDNSPEGNLERENSAPSLFVHKPVLALSRGPRALSLFSPVILAGELKHHPRHQRRNQHHRDARKHHHQARDNALLLSQLIRTCRARPCDAAPNPAPFAIPSRIGKPQKQHIAHRHAEDARHHHKQRHQIRLATERFGGCQRKRRGHRTHRQAALDFIRQGKQPRQPDRAAHRHHRRGDDARAERHPVASDNGEVVINGYGEGDGRRAEQPQ